MHLRYDYKLRGLLAEISAPELQELVRRLCERNEQIDLLDLPIEHVMYSTPTVKPTKKKVLWKFVMSVLGTIISSIIFILGIYKCIELLFGLVY